MEARTEEIRMEDIRIAERIRKEEGDLKSLALSVKDRGLINPVTVMEMSEGGYLLLAGARRIRACQSLGWETIRATVVPAVNAEEQLRIEIAENEERKEFTVEEQLNVAAQIQEIESEKARLRKLSGLKRGTELPTPPVVADLPQREQGKTRDIVAQKPGFTSTTQMRHAKEIADKRPDLLEKIDNGEISINAAYMIATGKTDGSKTVPKAPQPVFHDTLPEVSGDMEPNTAQDYLPVVHEAEEDDTYGEMLPPPGMPQDDGKYAGIPKLPGEVLKARLAPEERRRAREIEATMVHTQEFTIDTEIPEMFLPEDIDEHECLMEEPLYAELYEHDRKLQGVANLMRGELVTKCENYEKRIRSYEENIQTMSQTIQALREQLSQKHTVSNSTESEDEDL